MLVQTSRYEDFPWFIWLVGLGQWFIFSARTGDGDSEHRELQFHFMETVFESEIPKVWPMNPPLDYVLKDDDDVIVLAEDDSTINSTHPPIDRTQTRVTLPIKRIYLSKNTWLLAGTISTNCARICELHDWRIISQSGCENDPTIKKNLNQ